MRKDNSAWKRDSLEQDRILQKYMSCKGWVQFSYSLFLHIPELEGLS